LLQDVRGTVSFTASEEQVATLPLDGRNFIPLIALSPGVMLPPDRYKREQLPNLEIFAARISQAFDAVDSPGPVQPMVPIDLSACAKRIRAVR
jgi:hypothetical protein